MTATLLLQLKGPLQSWGGSSRYKHRATELVPSKSGVLGMLAAAQGRRRSDPIEDLAELSFAVRVDQPGTLLRDFQTAAKWQTTGDNSLVTRYFIEDAVFLAAVSSPNEEFIKDLEAAIQSPRFPLFLGRRSCPANVDLLLGVKDTDAVSALRDVPWKASLSHRRQRSRSVELPIYRDALPGERGVARRDVPVSFAQEHRRYEWREVVLDQERVCFDNPDGKYSDNFFETVISV